jgi:uncharacterized metal-binding protein YceD (DUF177 family)
MSQPKPLWSVPVALSDIPEAGRHYDLAADENTRAELAKLAAVRSLPHLEAHFDVTRHGPHGLHVKGRVAAVVDQNCVVTLEPMENKIEEDVDLVFVAPAELAEDDKVEHRAVADPMAPEPLVRDTVDLGGIATEFLILGIDPYPRKPEAAFEPPPAEDVAAANPFAALAALKKGQGDE